MDANEKSKILMFFAVMNEWELAQESLQLIKKDFLLEEEFDLAENEPFERLRNELIRIVQYLIDNDMPRLLNALYRIDLSEKKAGEIFTATPPDQIALCLSDAIIKRERKKAEYRLKYRT